jgi:peptide/nickel transport system substrate-binding protein
MVPPSLNGSLALGSGWEYQPEKAAQTLAESGHPGAQGIEPLRLYTSAEYVDLAEYVQSSVSKLGFVLDIEVMPTASLRDGMANARFGFFRASWIADYPEAENYLALFSSENHSPNGPNYTHYSNALFDQVFSRLQREESQMRRAELSAELEQLLMEDVPALPLFYDQVVRVARPGWQGLEPDPLNRLDLRRVRFNQPLSAAE